MIAYKKQGGSARRWTCVAALLALAMAGATRAPAAETTDLLPGTWVRLRVAPGAGGARVEVDGLSSSLPKPGTTLQGALRSLDEKTLILERPGKDPVQVPRDSISGLDVRRRSSKKVLGFAVGLVGGAAIGYAIAAATNDPICKGDPIEPLCPLFDLVDPANLGKGVGLILGGAGGALLGLVAAPGAKWQRDVPLGRVRVGVGPRRHRGIGLSLSVGF